MSEATLQQTLVYDGIRSINACVEKLPPAEAHEAIGQLRAHLEARAEQTAACAIAEEMGRDSSFAGEPDFSDLLGVG